MREEGVGEVFGVGFQLGQAAEGGGDLAAAVEDLDGGRVFWVGGRCHADLGFVAALFEHAEGGAKGEVADDVEGEVVEPVQSVDGGVAAGGGVAGGGLGELGPLGAEELEVGVDVLFELTDIFGGEGMTDDFAFAGVFGPVARVEEAASDRDECVVEFTGKVMLVSWWC